MSGEVPSLNIEKKSKVIVDGESRFLLNGAITFSSLLIMDRIQLKASPSRINMKKPLSIREVLRRKHR